MIRDERGQGAQVLVYIMASFTGTLYVGITGLFESRVRQHKLGEIEGFSRKYKCDRLVYFEVFDDVHKAIGREKQLKGWRRAKKIALIEKLNRRGEDLAEKWGPGSARAGTADQENSLTRFLWNIASTGSFDSPSRLLGLAQDDRFKVQRV